MTTFEVIISIVAAFAVLMLYSIGTALNAANKHYLNISERILDIEFFLRGKSR